MNYQLRAFVIESNRIEGIERAPTADEIAAHEWLIGRSEIDVATMEQFVHRVAREKLRDRAGMDVRVGNYHPPSGQPIIRRRLELLLLLANERESSPYDVHRQYEMLHPFMDGNGRSGRALWAWQMLRCGKHPFALPFLHLWYYQSLENA